MSSRLLLLAFSVVQGCYLSHTLDAPDDASVDAPRDAPDSAIDAPPDTFDSALDVGCDAGPIPEDSGLVDLTVDLLFVVDNSGSMAEEQQALAEQFPVMVRMLATGDLDDDGRPDAQPVSDLRVGVITTNLGAGGFETDLGCRVRPGEGSDGVLRTISRERGCARMLPPYLDFRRGDPVDPFVDDFACLAVVGDIGGCGIEQPLVASLKALLPADAPFPFLSGTAHGDGANAGFLRDDAILGIIYVSDEDDCSVADVEFFDPESDRYSWEGLGGGNLRCFLYPEARTPVESIVDALRSLKPNPNDLLVAAITGVPADAVSDPDAIDYEALLADPRMAERINPDRARGQLFPACDLEGTGFALPARRMVRAVAAFGDNGVVQSICDPTFGQALRGITSRLGDLIRRRRCR